MKELILFLLLLTSCIPLPKSPSDLEFRPTSFNNRQNIQGDPEIERRLRLIADKEVEWNEIEAQALESFSDVRKIIKQKCFDCHDSNTKLPLYGRVAPRINPVYKHQEEGLEALDFARVFPLMAKGDPSQLSLLKAIRSSVIERTMPLKSYTFVYPWRKVKDKDEKAIRAWVEPLIERIENFQEKYAEVIIENSPRGRAKQVLMNRCFRCHANGRSDGGFGNMQDLDSLVSSEYINLDRPELSTIFMVSEDGSMPPSETENLSQSELQIILEWIEFEREESTK